MFDLGWTELLLIGIVALIVVGPKDLPILFRNVGRFMGKARAMARDFSRAMEAAADEAGVKEVSKTLREASKAAANPRAYGADKVKSATSAFKPGGDTEKLSAERQEAKRKVAEATARAAEARLAREAAAAEAKTSDAPKPAPQPAPAGGSDDAPRSDGSA